MKSVRLYFNEIQNAIFNQLEGADQAIADYLFRLHINSVDENPIYGFDMGQAKNIDEWLNETSPGRKFELSQKSRVIFNSLYKLYHANTHLMQLYKLIELVPDIGKHFQIIKVSNSPDILDIRKLRPEEPREEIDQQTLIEACYQNNRKALGVLINNGILIPAEIPFGVSWGAAVAFDKTQLSDDDLLNANMAVNTVAKENLKQYEEKEKHSLARNNAIRICRSLLTPEVLKDNDNNSYFKYTFDPGANKNIDAWLSTHSPYKDDVKKTILEPQAKEILNKLFKLHHANENLTLLQSLISKDPDFCKQFKIIQLSHNPIIFDITKKLQSEVNKGEIIKPEELTKYIQKNLASGSRLMKEPSVFLPLKSASDTVLPLTTPKRLNFEYKEMSDEQARKILLAAAKENSLTNETLAPINNQDRSHSPSPPRSE